MEMGGNWRDLISDFGFRISEMSASENRGGLQSFSLGGWGGGLIGLMRSNSLI